MIAARTFCPDAVLPVHIPKFMYPREAGGARARALKLEHSPLMGLTYNDGDKFLDAAALYGGAGGRAIPGSAAA